MGDCRQSIFGENLPSERQIDQRAGRAWCAGYRPNGRYGYATALEQGGEQFDLGGVVAGGRLAVGQHRAELLRSNPVLVQHVVVTVSDVCGPGAAAARNDNRVT
ncbi:Uncharacterised protein [Mycobacteroides abscessus subsp. abscessus]|nr:Uncharacterised protein [Mycobacteroides abscessus subsp. abscessus]